MKRILILSLALAAGIANAVVLWDNGPLPTGQFTSGGVQAPSGYVWSECQSVGGVTNTTAGWNANLAVPYRIGDDFTTDASGWILKQIKFFSYQTGATAPSLTQVNVNIWAGSLGGTLIYSSGTVAITPSFTNIYRIFNNTPGTTRLVQTFELAIPNLALAGGTTYWLDWAITGSGSSGPWQPPVTLVGQLNKPGSNAMQQVSGVWGAIIDTGSGTPQDMVFIMSGDLPVSTYYPDEYVVTRGTEVGSHDPLKLKDADGVLFVTVSQKLQVSPALANAEVTARVMIPDPGTVKTANVTVVVRANDTPFNDPTCTQKILLKNQSTGSFELLDERKPTSTFSTILIALDSAGVAKYINSSTGEIDVRVGEFHGKPLSAGWKEDVDQIKVDITR